MIRYPGFSNTAARATTAPNEGPLEDCLFSGCGRSRGIKFEAQKLSQLQGAAPRHQDVQSPGSTGYSS